MNNVAACVLLSSFLALTGCSGVPEQLAFSSDTCAELEGLDVGKAIERLRLYDDHDLSSMVEYFAAAEAVGATAKAKFEAVSNALDLEPAEAPALDPGPDPLDRFLEASLAPNLVAESTFWASELERVCGTTELTEILWRMQADAWFMQAEPPSGYCEALTSGDFESMKSLAPDGHAEWVETVQLSTDGEADLLSAIVIDGRATAYYETHCP